MGEISNEKKIETIVKALDSKRAEDIQVIGIKDLTIIADYFVIANGDSNTQTKALAEEVEYKILGKSDLDNGIISDLSPVGSAIMNKKVGDIAEVHTPTGKVIKMKILAISK